MRAVRWGVASRMRAGDPTLPPLPSLRRLRRRLLCHRPAAAPRPCRAQRCPRARAMHEQHRCRWRRQALVAPRVLPRPGHGRHDGVGAARRHRCASVHPGGTRRPLPLRCLGGPLERPLRAARRGQRPHARRAGAVQGRHRAAAHDRVARRDAPLGRRQRPHAAAARGPFREERRFGASHAADGARPVRHIPSLRLPIHAGADGARRVQGLLRVVRRTQQ